MKFPTFYSTLSSDALLLLFIKNYELDPDSRITFLKRGFNDTYRIDSGDKKYILRVYKYDWRTHESIKTELKLITHLDSNGISVSIPIPDNNGALIREIDAPEGNRYAVLFSFAEGEQVRKLNMEQSFRLGAETAKIHLLTEGKTFGETAQDYSIEYQLDKTIRILMPVLKEHPEAANYLVELQEKYLETFRSIDRQELSQGVCHGDLQAENIHINGSRYTFFDFDFFGTGYLIYDIGIFCWYDHKNKPKEITNAFLDGYQSVRKLSAAELKLIPWFSTLRALFQMTLYCGISDGKQLPLWPAHQVAEFVKKVEKWQKERCDI